MPWQPFAVRTSTRRKCAVAHLKTVLAGADHFLGANFESLGSRIEPALKEHSLKRVDVENHELGLQNITPVDQLDAALGDTDSRLRTEGNPIRDQAPRRLLDPHVPGRDVELAHAVVVNAVGGDLERFVETRAILGTHDSGKA